MMRFGAAGTFALLSAAALLSCVNPKTDYDDYLARTADANTTVPTEDASFDGLSGSDAGFMNQDYVMACVSQTLQDDPTKPTLFIATASFIPSDSNGDGTFNFSDQALVVGSTDTSSANIAGPPVSVNGSVVTGGKVDIVFGMTSVPAAADPLGVGVGPIVFSDNTLHVDISPGNNLCASLSGHTTAPLATTLDPTQNFCAFFPYQGVTGTVPPLTAANFHCP
jgi:hypothetical protein